MKSRRKQIVTSSNGLAMSPEGALYRVDESLLDGGDNTAQLSITVHVINDFCIANLWVCQFGKWTRLQKERNLEKRSPSMMLLQGELIRAMQNADLNRHLNADLHYKLAIIGLQNQVLDLLK